MILLPFQIFIFHTLITGKIIQISEEIPLVVDYNLIPRIHPIRIFYEHYCLSLNLVGFILDLRQIMLNLHHYIKFLGSDLVTLTF